MSTNKLSLVVPDEALSTLRCALCQGYLSHFPVYMCKGIGSVCGRCPVLDDENPIRNFAYESIARILSFPCCYSQYGCLEVLSPQDVAEHEDSCGYRQYFCPFMPSGCCPWQGPSLELLEHYSDKHNIFVLKDYLFEIDFTSKYSENYLLQHGTELFIVQKKSDYYENTFWCSVSYIGPKSVAKKYSYQLQLEGRGNVCKNYSYSTQSIHTFADPNIDKHHAFEINSEFARKALDDPLTIVCNISITSAVDQEPKTEPAESKPPAATLVSKESVDETILSIIECPICFECMIPPIFQCETGHSICQTCKNEVSECPTCKSAIRNTRNMLVERITEGLQYYCKYRDYDCDFMAFSKDIKKHEADCKFGPYKCPFHDYFGCAWKGKLADVMSHANCEHSDNILELDTVFVPFDNVCEDTDCFLFEKHGELFKLLYKYENESFLWSLQVVGPVEDSKRFMFVLDIVDSNFRNQRFFVKRPCAPLVGGDEAFTGDVSYVKVPLDLIKDMMNGELVYKVHVVMK